MASTAPATRDWTYEKYLALDDDQRYEIIQGELLMTPAPGTWHQEISGELFVRFHGFVTKRRLGKVFSAPTDVVLSETEVVQPDILFIRADRVAEIVDERAVHGPPDLVVEILSPSSLRRDRHQKLALYQRHGIPEFWLVDAANRSIEVLMLENGSYQAFSVAAETGAVSSRVLNGFAVAVAEIFPPA